MLDNLLRNNQFFSGLQLILAHYSLYFSLPGEKHTEEKFLVAFILVFSFTFCFEHSFQSRQKPSKAPLTVLMES